MGLFFLGSAFKQDFAEVNFGRSSLSGGADGV